MAPRPVADRVEAPRIAELAVQADFSALSERDFKSAVRAHQPSQGIPRAAPIGAIAAKVEHGEEARYFTGPALTGVDRYANRVDASTWREPLFRGRVTVVQRKAADFRGIAEGHMPRRKDDGARAHPTVLDPSLSRAFTSPVLLNAIFADMPAPTRGAEPSISVERERF